MECLEIAGSSQLWTSLQVALDDKPKKAFNTNSSHWQYQVLPFTLDGTQAIFQRLMDAVLRPLQQYMAAYIDNIVVHLTT